MTSRRPLHDADNDGGFTLVEVIVTVVIIALVTTVLGAAIMVVLKSDASAVRIASESHDTQQGVNYFPLDVQAGPTGLGSYSTDPGSSGCPTYAAGANVLDFTKGSRRVSYRLEVTGARASLDRYTCDNVGTPTAPIWADDERVNIADTLDGSVAPAASVSLVPGPSGTLQYAELTLAQAGGDTAVLVASPRAEPRNSPGDCQTDNPIEASHGYGGFVEGDVSLLDGEVEGWLAVGGTLSWAKDITIASQNMSNVDPAFSLYATNIQWADVPGPDATPGFRLEVGAREDTVLGTSFQQVGDFVYELDPNPPTNNFLDLTGSASPQARRIVDLASADVIVFGTDFDELRDCSAQLARAIDLCATTGCAEEVGLQVSGSNLNLCPAGPRAQILPLPERYLGSAYSYSSVGPGCTGFSQTRPIIVNVIEDPTDADDRVDIDTDEIDWENVAGDIKNIVFNFPNAAEVNINSRFFGQVLAPFAHVNTFNDVEGGVIARSWTHHSGVVRSAGDLFDNEINWP